MASKGTPAGATFEASPNIALVKYWGQRDERLGLPFNSSLSLTLERMRTRTTVHFSRALKDDRLVLNGAEASGGPLDSVRRFLDRVRAMSGRTERALVVSRNNFPTASGLASSASGFAALAGAAAGAAGLSLSPPELSALARTGSGSACRSIFGGFVEWQAGRRDDGRDCRARPLHPPSYWPSLVDLVVAVADAPSKEVRSAVAMQRSVETSPLYAVRQGRLPRRLSAIRRAIDRRDAERLFPLIVEECDEFRAVCESTEPPLDYLTETSRRVLAEVRSLNDAEGRCVAGYTHDAGAHVHVFTRRAELPAVRRALRPVPGISRLWALGAGPGGRYVRSSR